jgi:hypothetical protein
MLSPLSKTRPERVPGYLLDENEFSSPYGMRSLSRYHQDHAFVFHVGHDAHRVAYLPAESDTGMCGGNSNWWAHLDAGQRAHPTFRGKE